MKRINWETAQWPIASAVIFALLLVYSVTFVPMTASAQTNSTRPAEQIGLQIIDDASSSQEVVPSIGTQWAIMSVRTSGIHISFDDTAATTDDLYVPANTVMVLEDYELLTKTHILDSDDTGDAIIRLVFMQAR